MDTGILRGGHIGVKAAGLARALRAGLPVLPGWVVPVGEGKSAMSAGAEAVRANGVAAGRVAVLSLALDPALVEELRLAVDGLGGRVIVRSSSPLEGDARWAGAFSSVTGVGREDVATAVRSCWASAFAVDPLRRLEGCGLGLEALELAVLVQPEIVPEAGGVARAGNGSVTVEGVRGHPGPLLSGWAEGARDRGLAGLVGADVVAEVGALADRVHGELGDDVIEWAACDGKVWLLQSLRSAPENRGAAQAMPMPADALRVAGRPAAPGTAAGPLVACWPHETGAKDSRGAIVLVDRPVPALAPLLYGAGGVIARTGAASSHLAEVARSLGVPMVVGCRPETVTGPHPAAGAWFATINGATGEVVLAPVLAEIEALGLDLLEIQKLTPHRTSPEPGDSRSP
ncbi:MAG TPA: PEP/pyruvate-binding domain-containing protein [Streptosporangiaceae bacterium]